MDSLRPMHLHPEAPNGSRSMIRVPGGIADRAIIECRIWFSDETYVDVYERVTIDGDTPHRTQYAYDMMNQGELIIAAHYEPDDPEDFRYHTHRITNGKRLHIPGVRTTLKQFIEDECWPAFAEIHAGL